MIKIAIGTHLGLYLACHMNGPAAFPMQYAQSMIALVVMRFVCPAVTADTHDSDSTNPVVPTPVRLCEPASTRTSDIEGNTHP
jgi:hypothetical protein